MLFTTRFVLQRGILVPAIIIGCTAISYQLNGADLRNPDFAEQKWNSHLGATGDEHVSGWFNTGSKPAYTSSEFSSGEGERHVRFENPTVYNEAGDAFAWNSGAQVTLHALQPGETITLKFKYNIADMHDNKMWNAEPTMRFFYVDADSDIHESNNFMVFHEWFDTHDWEGNAEPISSPSEQPWKEETIANIEVPAEAAGKLFGIWLSNAALAEDADRRTWARFDHFLISYGPAPETPR